jgi:hypothetical protein
MSTSTRRTELAHRASDGIDVYLFWNEPTSRVTVCVLDGRSDDGFELELDGRQALDAFNHPFCLRPDATTDRGDDQSTEEQPCTHGSITPRSRFPAP